MKKHLIQKSLPFLLLGGLFSCADDTNSFEEPTPRTIRFNLEEYSEVYSHDLPLTIEASVESPTDTELSWSLIDQPQRSRLKEDETHRSHFNFAPLDTGHYKIAFTAREDGLVSSDTLSIYYKPYTGNGVIIFNEGKFSLNKEEKGSVNFLEYGSEQPIDRIFKKTNNNELGVTTQSAMQHRDRTYLISKEAPQLVVVETSTFKEVGRKWQFANNAHSFIGIDANKGYLSTDEGVFILNLNDLSVTGSITGVANGGLMKKIGDVVFIQPSDGSMLTRVDATNDQLLGTIDVEGVCTGMDLAGNGILWVGSSTNVAWGETNPASKLFKVEASGVHTKETLPAGVYISWDGVWNEGHLSVSKTTNEVYFHNGQQVYKYVDGDLGSLSAPILDFTQKDVRDKLIYGGGPYIHPESGKLYLNAINDYGPAASQNSLFIISPEGVLEKVRKYGESAEDAFFPAGIQFL